MNATILRVEHLMMHFGGIKALNDVNLEVQRGSITALIGPNGAGKTTVFNCLTGFYRASGGNILFNARNKTTNVIQVLGQKFQPGDWLNPAQLGQRLFYKMFGGTHLVNRAGLARTFQNIRLFNSMTVLENVMVGLDHSSHYSLLEAALHIGRYFPAERAARAKAMALLDYIGIAEYANMQATNLSYGNQRKVEIARALATGPKLLLLDEPAAGMNPKETEDLASLIFRMRKDYQLSVLLIEHDMPFVNALCERVMVLEYGKPLFSGLMSDAIQHPEVISAYLGDVNYA